MKHAYLVYGLAPLIILIASTGIGFMLACVRRRRLTNRNLAIGGSGVILCFVLLLVLVEII